MMANKMKGITCCGDCVYYDWKKHRCKRGFNDATNPQNHFFDNCALPDVQPVVHGKWIFDCERRQGDGWIYKQRHCSACGFQTVECLNYCQKCGAMMDLDG